MGCIYFKPKNYLLNNLTYTYIDEALIRFENKASMCVCNNYANFANFIWNVGAQNTCVT